MGKNGHAALPDAAVLLFEGPEEREPRLIGRMFTDEQGQFLFDLLDPGKLDLMTVSAGGLRGRKPEQRKRRGGQPRHSAVNMLQH